MKPHIIVSKDESGTARAVMKRLLKMNEEEKIELDIIPLQVGDFIAGEYFIERKKVGNLVGSILDGQMWRQAESLLKASEEWNMSPVVLVEGSLTFILKSPHYKDFNPASAIGVLDALHDGYKIQVVHSPNSYFTVLWLLRFARDPTKKEAVHAVRSAGKKEWPMDLKARHVLEGVEGIGGVTSTKLLGYHKSLKNVFLEALDYKGKKGPLAKIAKILHHKYGSEKKDDKIS